MIMVLNSNAAQLDLVICCTHEENIDINHLKWVFM